MEEKQNQNSRTNKDVVPQSSRARAEEISNKKNSESGDKKAEKEESLSQLDEARNVVNELKKANEEKKALLEREEQLRINKVLSGETEAGIQAKEPTKEEKTKERVNKWLEGTGFKI